jgi:hypothetical protein
MQQEFLKNYFPIGTTNDYRRAIMGFSQYDREQFYESWERLNDLVKKFQHHVVPKWQLMQYIYDGFDVVFLCTKISIIKLLLAIRQICNTPIKITLVFSNNFSSQKNG